MTKFKAVQKKDKTVIREEIVEANNAVDAMGKFQTGYLRVTHDAEKTHAFMTNADGRVTWEVTAA